MFLLLHEEPLGSITPDTDLDSVLNTDIVDMIKREPDELTRPVLQDNPPVGDVQLCNMTRRMSVEYRSNGLLQDTLPILTFKRHDTDRPSSMDDETKGL